MDSVLLYLEDFLDLVVQKSEGQDGGKEKSHIPCQTAYSRRFSISINILIRLFYLKFTYCIVTNKLVHLQNIPFIKIAVSLWKSFTCKLS